VGGGPEAGQQPDAQSGQQSPSQGDVAAQPATEGSNNAAEPTTDAQAEGEVSQSAGGASKPPDAAAPSATPSAGAGETAPQAGETSNNAVVIVTPPAES